MDDGKSKVFNDPIHGLIELHPLCVKIIDTPEFQRLRFLKQLGSTYLVYPGASHNRFEHSLGVCHLAGRLVRAIKSRQPDLGITDKDVLCVEIAGLCHDLGHGPFSHLFEGEFLPKVRPETKWAHEKASIDLFDHMIEKRNLKPEFDKCGLNEQDIRFIKEQIRPEIKDENNEKFRGRPGKPFLYEIVANKRNGIDVDKWDYLARDCYMLGIRNNFDHNRCIHFARVLNVCGEKQICTREKEAGHLYDMFYTRYMLHRRAYQHKTACSINFMITDALIKANDYIKFTGTDGEEKKMSEAIDDMEAYSKMTDHVIFLILNSNDKNLAESKEILNNVMSRKLTYKYTTHSVAKRDKMLGKEDISDAVKEIIEKKKPGHQDLNDDDIKVQLVQLDYGKKSENPMDHLMFYRKNDQDNAVPITKEQESSFLPKEFLEQQIRLYCKANASDASHRAARYAFGQWCREKDLPAPMGADFGDE
ncbi:deoxynucleoside triphosphate triphosphohydrolase SAMHD1-like [Mya arenaria]|uniref:deoxynucleoside triphosphate triphosphohydrolase SAMHD1-like n=1 Tax=Mya arenaria TaxID=6604 RepID=UPI0022DF95AA|nr:deoxynucleoside triphosphate triphosphohydrolase SAMHD1-like [Mya arenaria]